MLVKAEDDLKYLQVNRIFKAASLTSWQVYQSCRSKADLFIMHAQDKVVCAFVHASSAACGPNSG